MPPRSLPVSSLGSKKEVGKEGTGRWMAPGGGGEGSPSRLPSNRTLFGLEAFGVGLELWRPQSCPSCVAAIGRWSQWMGLLGASAAQYNFGTTAKMFCYSVLGISHVQLTST